MQPLPPKHREAQKDGYVLVYYPGFLREGSIQAGMDQPVVLYEQTYPHDIRDQPDEPLTRYVVGLTGGINQRNVTLTIDDPERSIAEIVVRFYPRGFRPGEGRIADPDETLSLRDGAVICPPIC
ncbi:MAG TPA: hypothetical protein VHG28_22735 [Longimicrobiaceae bacterium]|nr:hypothetical protein [Longimicrobiaceae bacterium]